MGSALKPSRSEVPRATNTCFHTPSQPSLPVFRGRKMVSFSSRTFFSDDEIHPKTDRGVQAEVSQDPVQRNAVVVGGGRPRWPGRPSCTQL